MCRIVALLTLVGFLLTAGAADARRRADRAERAAIAKVMQVPARCATVYVSTVNRRWASFRFNFRGEACLPYASDGVAVLRKRHGRWRQVTAGSAFECPVRNVPPRIVKDLRIECF